MAAWSYAERDGLPAQYDDDSSHKYETDLTAETALPDEEPEETESGDGGESGEETAGGHQRDLNEATERSPETDPDTSYRERD